MGFHWTMLLGCLLAATSFAADQAAPKEYRDPKGRFVFSIPAGWSVSEIEDGARLTKDNARAEVTVIGKVGSGDDVIQSVAERTAIHWSQLSGGRRSTVRFGELLGEGQFFGAIDEKDVTMALRVAAAIQSGSAAVVVYVAPLKEWTEARKQLQLIDATVRFQLGPREKPSTTR